jgi:Flp pilus assembly protein TadG
MGAMQLNRSEEGSAMIELSLIMSLMVLVIIALADYGLWMQRAIRLQEAAAAGAAYGAVPGNSNNTTNMTYMANFNATGSYTGSDSVAVNSTYFYTCSPGGAHVNASTSCASGAYGAPLEYVEVTTSSTITSPLKLPGIPSSITIPGTAIYRVLGIP